jgi:hypothetical protein
MPLLQRPLAGKASVKGRSPVAVNTGFLSAGGSQSHVGSAFEPPFMLLRLCPPRSVALWVSHLAASLRDAMRGSERLAHVSVRNAAEKVSQREFASLV